MLARTTVTPLLRNFSRMSTTKNSLGLTPQESKALRERSPKPEETKILTAIKEMYSCKPKENTFSIYADSAVFHDPVGIANGKKSIAAQFVGLEKIFSYADIPKFRLLENPASIPPSSIIIDQDVSYHYKEKSDKPTKTVNSLLILERDTQGLVTKHTEEWDHSKSTTSNDGFFGTLNEYRKKLTAGATDMMVGKDANV